MQLGVDFIHVSYKSTAFLLSVLRTFIHDPLVEWRKKSKNQKMNPADTELALGEIHNDQVGTHNKSSCFLPPLLKHLNWFQRKRALEPLSS